MSSGFVAGAHGDLDDIFDAYQGGTKPAATGFHVGNQDLRDRYSPRNAGDDIGFDTGFVVGSTDLRHIFAAKGTSTKATVIPFGHYIVQAIGLMGTSRGSRRPRAGINVELRPDGTWDIGHSASPATLLEGSPTSGNWHKHPAAGVGAEYEVRLIAHLTISDPNNTGSPSYTASTGWQSLSAACFFHAETGFLSAEGSVTVNGYWTIQIRKKGGTAVTESRCYVTVRATRLYRPAARR